LKGFVMPDRKKKSAGKGAKPKQTTAKRRTALPVSAARSVAKVPVTRAALVKQPVMRLVLPPPEIVEPSQEMIARRAFENWMMYLRLANDPVQNWIEAESQLQRELNAE
jgi:hypothetical protein